MSASFGLTNGIEMRVHHLNCGTMCPVAPALVNEEGKLVCHVLVVETNDGLVLVDSGMGLDDIARSRERIGPVVALMRPLLDPGETAVRRIERLGFQRRDVRHIVLTHLDPDHAGGLSDFPDATVHVHAREHRAAIESRRSLDRFRYRTTQFAHQPRFERYEPSDGDPWFGFAAVRDLRGLPPEILLVPLLGHSRGHSGIAVQTDAGWLLHCGDAYYHRDEIVDPPRCPIGLRVFQTTAEQDRPARLANQARLRELKALHGSEVRLFCAHDPAELARLTGRPGSS